MVLYENGKVIAHPKTIREAKKMIAVLDESMACVDVDPQEYVVFDAKGRQVYTRPRVLVP